MDKLPCGHDESDCDHAAICVVYGWEDEDARMRSLEEFIDLDDEVKIPQDCPIL